MINLLLCIIALPFVVVVALWFSSKLWTTPWMTTAEAFVRLLTWAARWLTAIAEAADTAVMTASRPPLRTSCELARETRMDVERTERETNALIERTKQELTAAPTPRLPLRIRER